MMGARPRAPMDHLYMKRCVMGPAWAMGPSACRTRRRSSLVLVVSHSGGPEEAPTFAPETRGRLIPETGTGSGSERGSGSEQAAGRSASAPLVDAVVHRAERRHELPFHVPGHKRGSRLAPAQRACLDQASWARDTTELAGLDNLQNPEGVIREAMALASELWRCDHTWFLVNGATTGIHAAIMATCPAPDDCIIMARNAHQSAFHGVVLAGCRVRYVVPECGDGFAHHVSVGGLEAAFRAASDEEGVRVRAVLVVSPTYYGVQSDLVGLKAVCDRHGALLIVDEAHGAHLDFIPSAECGPGGLVPRRGHSALGAGASLVVQSTHKQLGSLTQSSMLHGHGIDATLKTRIDLVLRMLQTSSPSYLLMASLDAARAALAAGVEVGDDSYIGEPHAAAMRIREYFAGFEGGLVSCDGCGMTLRLLDVEDAYAMDPWRLTVVIDGGHLRAPPTGWSVARLLESARGVVSEMATQNAIVFACSIGTTATHAEGLIHAIEWLTTYDDEGGELEYLAQRHDGEQTDERRGNRRDYFGPSTCPRNAYIAKHAPIPVALAANRVAAETITVYPPGIPIVCIGDVLTPDTLSHIQSLAHTGASITGATDATMATILVVDDT